MLFDTHVNLHGDVYAEDREDVLNRASDAGIGYFLSICDKPESISRIAEITAARSDMWRSVGCHPHYAKDHTDLTTEFLMEQAQHKDVVAIGETGLDQHYGYSDLEDQKAVFGAHIRAAQETGLPIIVHTREADDHTGDMLEDAYKEKPFPILMHCYTSGQRLADRARDLGAWFSVSGIITFKNAHDVRSVAKTFPLDKLVLETDCPYLAPVPMRGRRNEPAYLKHVCDYVSEFLEMSPDELEERTTRNAFDLFRKAASQI